MGAPPAAIPRLFEAADVEAVAGVVVDAVVGTVLPEEEVVDTDAGVDVVVVGIVFVVLEVVGGGGTGVVTVLEVDTGDGTTGGVTGVFFD